VTRGRCFVVVLAALVGVIGVGRQVARALGAGDSQVATLTSNSGPADIEIVIPHDALGRAARGEPVLDVPSPLVVHVGDVLRIVNRDDVAQYVGPFLVGAHSTVSERFTEPGLSSAACVLHRSGRLEIRVLA
jgi:hypothetical protein